MNPRKSLQIAALAALFVGLIAVLSLIVQWHSQQSGSFPEFSSYRTLPDGTSALYDALRQTPGLSAERNIQPLTAGAIHNAALLILGVRPVSLNGNGQWFSDMEDLACKGNRVIVGLLPNRNRFLTPDAKELRDALQHWGIKLAFVRETNALDEADEKLTPGWPMYFSESPHWNVLRQENGHPVAIELILPKGSVVLLANPFLFSNGALVEDRQTAFLAALIGPARQVVFDETHFGIEESGSIAAIARRFHLQGFVLGLALTAALFVWKNAAGFPPPSPASISAPVTGEDSAGAFVNLLRRNIRREQIVRICVDQWRKMYARKSALAASPDIDLAADADPNPARAYAEIQRILGAEKNRS